MTDQQQPPAPWPAQHDPRASAAAAKAYAKASRPWYKKKRWIALLVIVGIFVIAAATSSGSDDDDPPTSASQGQSNDGDGGTKPQADNSSNGKGALTWGNWEVVGKLQVDQDGLNQYDVVTRVRNIGDSVDSGFFTVTILKGTDIVGTATCSTSDINPGSVGTAECFSTDDFVPGWTEVTIEDAF
ncbi:hypothetical protein [Nocardioides sp. R-C-SC26]|uniref:hypothetical protein n=1 Tax=Nocardioides sp. R-C-SC26 TaxID=2870414 RepID=UPI001E3FB4B7|nr:hypothetical protein [Nocardioides sp. R-C-SC26]